MFCFGFLPSLVFFAVLCVCVFCLFLCWYARYGIQCFSHSLACVCRYFL